MISNDPFMTFIAYHFTGLFEEGLLVPMPYIYWPIGLHISKAKAIVKVRIISEVRVYP